MKKKKKRRNSVILVLLLFAVAGTFAVRLVQLQIGIREQRQALDNLQVAYELSLIHI